MNSKVLNNFTNINGLHKCAASSVIIGLGTAKKGKATRTSNFMYSILHTYTNAVSIAEEIFNRKTYMI